MDRVKNDNDNLVQNNDSSNYIVEEVGDFGDLDIPEELLRGIFGFGFEFPSLYSEKQLSQF